jgi:microcystin-dependent protein
MIDVKKFSRFLGRGLAATGTMATLAASAGILSVTTASPALACAYEEYIGSVCFTAASFCPQGYVAANGQALPISQYQALYSLINGLYGPPNTSTFTLPDLRGRSAAGTGAGPGLGNIALGAAVGAQQIFLIPPQVPLAAHTHGAAFSGTGGGAHAVEIPAQPGTLAVTAKLVAKQVQGGANATDGTFLGQGSTSGGTQAPIYVPAATMAGTAELGGLDVQLTGTPGSPKIDFNLSTGITGGTVSIMPNPVIPATQAVVVQSPALGLTACIVADGLYPPRP